MRKITMRKIKRKQWLVAAVALLATSLVATGAHAQNDGPGSPPPGPPQGPPLGPPPAGPPEGRPRPNRTPKEQSAQRAQMLKRALEDAGIIDVQVQNIVVAFAGEREAATQALQEKSRAVGAALRSATASEKEIAAALGDFRAAVAAERIRRTNAEKTLDTAIGWSKKPRLDALLTTAGLVGDEAAVAGMGGRGMRGRGPMPGDAGRRGGRNGGAERPRGMNRRDRFGGPETDGPMND